MLTPERLQILHQKYNEAKSTGLNHNVSPPLQSFTSELVGTFARKARAARQFDSKKIKDSFHRILPPLVIASFKHCAAVTQEKMASPLDFNQTSRTTGASTNVTLYLVPSLTVSPPLSLTFLFVIPSMTMISCT